MSFKKINKSIGRFIGWLSLCLCCWVMKFVPSKRIYDFAEFIAYLAYRIAAKHKKIALESLSTAFGNTKTQQEIEQIARDCFVLMAKSAIELLFLMDKPQLLKQHVEVVGMDNLKNAFSKGKGIILVSAHFGNFPLLLSRLGIEGYKVSGIMRPMRDKRVEKIFLSKRQIFGVNTIYSQPRKECVENTIRALRNNEIVFIPIDQNFGTAGVFVDFFGKKAATATGPIIFAQRTQAAILPCFIVRQKDNRHKIYFEPPMELETADNNSEFIRLNIQKLTNIIEKYIRQYPAEWGWIHRRWKSRPDK